MPSKKLPEICPWIWFLEYLVWFWLPYPSSSWSKVWRKSFLDGLYHNSTIPTWVDDASGFEIDPKSCGLIIGRWYLQDLHNNKLRRNCCFGESFILATLRWSDKDRGGVFLEIGLGVCFWIFVCFGLSGSILRRVGSCNFFVLSLWVDLIAGVSLIFWWWWDDQFLWLSHRFLLIWNRINFKVWISKNIFCS